LITRADKERVKLWPFFVAWGRVVKIHWRRIPTGKLLVECNWPAHLQIICS